MGRNRTPPPFTSQSRLYLDVHTVSVEDHPCVAFRIAPSAVSSALSCSQHAVAIQRPGRNPVALPLPEVLEHAASGGCATSVGQSVSRSVGPSARPSARQRSPTVPFTAANSFSES